MLFIAAFRSGRRKKRPCWKNSTSRRSINLRWRHRQTVFVRKSRNWNMLFPIPPEKKPFRRWNGSSSLRPISKKHWNRSKRSSMPQRTVRKNWPAKSRRFRVLWRKHRISRWSRLSRSWMDSPETRPALQNSIRKTRSPSRCGIRSSKAFCSGTSSIRSWQPDLPSSEIFRTRPTEPFPEKRRSCWKRISR